MRRSIQHGGVSAESILFGLHLNLATQDALIDDLNDKKRGVMPMNDHSIPTDAYKTFQ